MEARTPPHKRLENWRLKAGLTQKALAELIGCSDSKVSKIESADQRPGLTIAVNIARVTANSGTPIRVEDWP